MEEDGTCPEAMLNNVARTAVTEPGGSCTDARGAEGCVNLIAAGLGCKAATMQTDCRMTCGLCDHRRAQISARCMLSQFESQAAVVNTACCDDADCTGVPICDAVCHPLQYLLRSVRATRSVQSSALRWAVHDVKA